MSAHETGNMRLTLHVWRQLGNEEKGRFEVHTANDVSPDMSFLEMIDELNERLTREGKDPIAFDSDCREGICGTCSMVVNGQAHGPQPETTICQVHMRTFSDGDTIYIEPFRAKSFPVIKDLVVDRSALDRIQQAGGFVSLATGNAPDANSIPISKELSDLAMDAAACIGCGACVAACPNAAAMLFTSAKISQYALLPQGQPERQRRALSMVAAMDEEGFGNCTNHYECMGACPKGISVDNIGRMNREFMWASVKSRD